MVAVISSNDLGVFTSNGSARGSAGSAGSGRPDQAYVNTSTGNLVIQQRDESLAALGLDLALVRTYNSQGLMDDDNGDNWRLSPQQRLYGLPANPASPSAGSTVRKVFGDGADVVYTWNGSAFVSTDGDGAHDTLTYSGGQWTWTDGSGRNTETYDSTGRLTHSRDADGNTITYDYTGTRLTQIDMARDGTAAIVQQVFLEYADAANPNNLTRIRVVIGGQPQVLTHYRYDSANRLAQVVVDLTPQTLLPLSPGGPITATLHDTYVTNYEYVDTTSRLIRSITHGDGTYVRFDYVSGTNRIYSYTEGSGAAARTTTFAYSDVTAASGTTVYQRTEVRDAFNTLTVYIHDDQGRLRRLENPLGLATEYVYTGDHLTAIRENAGALNGPVRETTFSYDTSGNLRFTRDALGNTVERTYNANNQIETESRYLTPDPDAINSGNNLGVSLTTRYLYDAENHLRFMISPEGRVTEHQYAGVTGTNNRDGLRTTTRVYGDELYSGSYTLGVLTTWANARDAARVQRLDYQYDFRGQLSRTTAWSRNELNQDVASITQYVYDQRGQLLQTITPAGYAATTLDPNTPSAAPSENTAHATTFVYDGLGRLLSTFEWVATEGAATRLRSSSTTFYDNENRVRLIVSNTSNGTLSSTTNSVYDSTGNIVTTTTTGAGAGQLSEIRYTYDAAGRLRFMTDATGVRQHVLYDAAGRKSADIDGNGTLTEYVYSATSQLIKTIRYATAVNPLVIADAAGNLLPATTLDTLRTTANANPSQNQISRVVYDGAGRVVYSLNQVDGTPQEFSVARTVYDGANRITDVIQYAVAVSIGAETGEIPAATIAGLVNVSHADNRHTRNFYDADGMLAGSLDAMGYLTTHQYDAAGQLIKQIGHANQAPVSNAENATLRTTGTLAQLRDAVGVDTEVAEDAEEDIVRYFFYDGQGRQIGEIDGEGYFTQTQYNLDGQVSSVTRYDRQFASTLVSALTISPSPIDPASVIGAVTVQGNNTLVWSSPAPDLSMESDLSVRLVLRQGAVEITPQVSFIDNGSTRTYSAVVSTETTGTWNYSITHLRAGVTVGSAWGTLNRTDVGSFQVVSGATVATGPAPTQPIAITNVTATMNGSLVHVFWVAPNNSSTTAVLNINGTNYAASLYGSPGAYFLHVNNVSLPSSGTYAYTITESLSGQTLATATGSLSYTAGSSTTVTTVSITPAPVDAEGTVGTITSSGSTLSWSMSGTTTVATVSLTQGATNYTRAATYTDAGGVRTFSLNVGDLSSGVWTYAVSHTRAGTEVARKEGTVTTSGQSTPRQITNTTVTSTSSAIAADPVSGLSVAGGSNGLTSIVWSVPADGSVTATLEISSNGGSSWQSHTATRGATQFSVSGLTYGVGNYLYRITHRRGSDTVAVATGSVSVTAVAPTITTSMSVTGASLQSVSAYEGGLYWGASYTTTASTMYLQQGGSTVQRAGVWLGEFEGMQFFVADLGDLAAGTWQYQIGTTQGGIETIANVGTISTSGFSQPRQVSGVSVSSTSSALGAESITGVTAASVAIGSTAFSWNATANYSVQATLEISSNGGSSWQSYAATRVGGYGEYFQVAGLTHGAGSHLYRITHRVGSDVVAIANGTLTISVSPSSTALTGFAPTPASETVAIVSGQVQSHPVLTATRTSTSSQQQVFIQYDPKSGLPVTELQWVGTNRVDFSSTGGGTRVVLEYYTSNGTYASRDQTFSGSYVQWNDGTYAATGGIGSIIRARIYDSNGIVIRDTNGPVHIPSVRWNVPTTSHTARTFSYRPVGSSTWIAAPMASSGGQFSVTLPSITAGNYEYSVIYSGMVSTEKGPVELPVATASGQFNFSGSSLTITSQVNNPPGSLTTVSTSGVNLTWSGTPQAGDTIVAAYHNGSAWVSLAYTGSGGNYSASLNGMPSGTYEYSISYMRSGVAYARGTGLITVTTTAASQTSNATAPSVQTYPIANVVPTASADTLSWSHATGGVNTQVALTYTVGGVTTTEYFSGPGSKTFSSITANGAVAIPYTITYTNLSTGRIYARGTGNYSFTVSNPAIPGTLGQPAAAPGVTGLAHVGGGVIAWNDAAAGATVEIRNRLTNGSWSSWTTASTYGSGYAFNFNAYGDGAYLYEIRYRAASGAINRFTAGNFTLTHTSTPNNPTLALTPPTNTTYPVANVVPTGSTDTLSWGHATGGVPTTVTLTYSINGGAQQTYTTTGPGSFSFASVTGNQTASIAYSIVYRRNSDNVKYAAGAGTFGFTVTTPTVPGTLSSVTQSNVYPSVPGVTNLTDRGNGVMSWDDATASGYTAQVRYRQPVGSGTWSTWTGASTYGSGYSFNFNTPTPQLTGNVEFEIRYINGSNSINRRALGTVNVQRAVNTINPSVTGGATTTHTEYPIANISVSTVSSASDTLSWTHSTGGVPTTVTLTYSINGGAQQTYTTNGPGSFSFASVTGNQTASIAYSLAYRRNSDNFMYARGNGTFTFTTTAHATPPVLSGVTQSSGIAGVSDLRDTGNGVLRWGDDPTGGALVQVRYLAANASAWSNWASASATNGDYTFNFSALNGSVRYEIRYIAGAAIQRFASGTVEVGNRYQPLPWTTTVTMPTAAQLAGAVRHSTSFTYNGAGQVLTETVTQGVGTSTSSSTTSIAYDDGGNVISMARGIGSGDVRTTQTKYDYLGRVTQTLSAEGSAALAAGTVTVTEAWDRYGVTYTYDTASRRTSATTQTYDPVTQTTQSNATYYYYNEDNQLRFTVTRVVVNGQVEGEVAELRYNALGQLVEQIAYANRLSDLTGIQGGLYTSALALTPTPDANRDAKTTFTYSLRGQMATSITTLGASVTNRYNAFGELRNQVNVLNAAHNLRNETEYVYDHRGLLTHTRRDPNGVNFTDTVSYDAFGRATRRTDVRGNVTRAEYDGLGRTIATYDALNHRSAVEYDAFSRTVRTVDKNHNVVTYQYLTGEDLDATILGERQVRVTSSKGTVTQTLNVHGELYTFADESGAITRNAYNRDGQLTDITVAHGTADASRTHYDYDTSGRTVRVTEGAGSTATGGSAGPRVTEYRYDAANRRVEEIVMNARVDGALTNLRTQYRYDGKGNLTRKIDPRGSTPGLENAYSTWYVYDADNRLRFTVDALGGVTETGYNMAGMPVSTRRYATAMSPLPTGDVLTSVTVAKTNQDRFEQYVYDQFGREVYTIRNAEIEGVQRAIVTKKDYDATGNVIRTTAFVNSIAASVAPDTYETVGEVTVAPHTEDRVEYTAYDANNRAAYSIDALGAVTRFVYDANGNVVQTTAYNNTLPMMSMTALKSAVRIEKIVTGLRAWAANDTYTDIAPTPTISPNDRTTRFWYDGVDRLRYTLDAEGYLTETSYNDTSRIQARVIYANSQTALVGLVASDSPLRTADVVAFLSANANADQNTVTVLDAAGRVSRVFNADNNHTAIAAVGYANVPLAGANYEEFEYDGVGNKTSYRNQKGAVWNYEYDANRRLTKEITPQVEVTNLSETLSSTDINQINLTANASVLRSIVTKMTYDALGNVRTRQEGVLGVWNASTHTLTEDADQTRSRLTTYEYDQLGRQTKTIFPDVHVYSGTPSTDIASTGLSVTAQSTYRSRANGNALYSEVFYDTLGNAWKNLDVAGNSSYKVYDQLGRVTFEIDAERYVTQYNYDAVGNQLTMTRYSEALASPLESSNPSFGAFKVLSGNAATRTLTAAYVSGNHSVLIATDSSRDRTLTKTYDLRNRVASVAQPGVFVFIPNDTGSGGTATQSTLPTAVPTTTFRYSAFGQVTEQREKVGPARPDAVTRYFYDKVGNRRYTLDALGFVTEDRYDETGDVAAHIEYAKAASLTWAPGAALPAADASSGPNRQVNFTYDKLNRKTHETQVNLVTHQLDAALTPNSRPNIGVTSVTTRYGFDAVGNQVSVTANYDTAASATTYTRYDVLGRIIGMAEPTRNRGDDTSLTPIVLMKRDAYGNLVESTQFANSATLTVDNGIWTAETLGSVISGDQNRTSRFYYDSHNHVTHSENARGDDEFAVYSAGGKVAKQWQYVRNTNPSPNSADALPQALVSIYEYDRLGRQIRLWEPTSNGGSGVANRVVKTSTYNAFGEMIYKGILDGSANQGQQEYFDYDQAGRLWRTNSGDGVDKVYLYNLQGKSTATITANKATDVATVDLKSLASPEAVYNLSASKQVREETVYDVLGRTIAQRTVSYTSVRTGNPTADAGLYLYWDVPSAAYPFQTLEYRIAGSNGAFVTLPTIRLTTAWFTHELSQLRGASISHLALGNYEFQLTTTTSTETKVSQGTFAVASQLNVQATANTVQVITGQIAQNSGQPYFYSFDDANVFVSTPSGAGHSLSVQVNLGGIWSDLVCTSFGNGSYSFGNSLAAGGVIPDGSYAIRVRGADTSGATRFWATGTLSSNFGWFAVSSVDVGTSLSPQVYDGNNVLSWAAPPDAASASFKYKLRNTSSWSAPLPVDISTAAAIHAVNLSALAAGDYDYEIVYLRADGRYLAIGSGVINAANTSGGISNDGTSIENASRLVSGVSLQTLDRWGNALNVDVYQYGTSQTAGRQHAKYTYNQWNQVAKVERKASPSDWYFTTVGINYYDQSGRLIATENGSVPGDYWQPGMIVQQGSVNKFRYNSAGQLIQEIHADAGIRHTNSAGLPVQEEYGYKKVVYNIFGEQVQVTDEERYRSRYGYDKAGNLTDVTREVAIGGFTASDPYDYRYRDANNALLPNLHHQSYTYDQAGRRISETTDNVTVNGAGGQAVTTYDWYDLQGNLRKHRTAIGFETTYAYDVLNKKIGETNADNKSQSWTYDYFGHLLRNTDLGGAVTGYAYDAETGLLTRQLGQRGQNIKYFYDAYGQATYIKDRGLAVGNSAGVVRDTFYGYDSLGRRAREQTWVSGVEHQQSSIHYDAFGRISRVYDPTVQVQYEYNANDMRYRTTYRYRDGNETVSRALDYQYDRMGRVTNMQTVIPDVDFDGYVQDVVVDTLVIGYDAKGNRTGFAKTDQNHNGIDGAGYIYDGLGRLTVVMKQLNGYVPVDTRTYDGASRVTQSVTSERITVGWTTQIVNRRMDYNFNADGQLTYQHSTRNGVAEWALFEFEYRPAGNLTRYKLNVRDQYVSQYDMYYNDLHQETQTYVHTLYTAGSHIPAPPPGDTRRYYNANGELVAFVDVKDRNKDRYFVNNQDGQALSVIQGSFGLPNDTAHLASATVQTDAFRTELTRAQISSAGSVSGAVFNRFVFSNGNLLGNINNRGGSVTANFDVHYSPIDSDYPSKSPATIVVQTGETLRSIAQRVFGDGSLWYVIADANALTEGPDEELEANATLRVPNEVVSMSNTATTFKPFDLQDALGDTTPTQPMPPPPAPKKGCGVLGQVLLVIVAVVVTAIIMYYAPEQLTWAGEVIWGAVAAAAGSAASQGVAIAADAQDEFDWKQVGAAGLGGALGVAFSGLNIVGKLASTPLGTAINGIAANALSQGVSLLVGVQEEFDWASIAKTAIGAPMSQSAGADLGRAFGGGFAGDVAGRMAGNFINEIVYAVFSKGKVDYVNVVGDAFGNALGNSIVGRTNKPGSASGTQETQTEAMDTSSDSALDYFNANNPDLANDLFGDPLAFLSNNPEVDFTPTQLSPDERQIPKDLLRNNLPEDLIAAELDPGLANARFIENPENLRIRTEDPFNPYAKDNYFRNFPLGDPSWVGLEIDDHLPDGRVVKGIATQGPYTLMSVMGDPEHEIRKLQEIDDWLATVEENLNARLRDPASPRPEQLLFETGFVLKATFGKNQLGVEFDTAKGFNVTYMSKRFSVGAETDGKVGVESGLKVEEGIQGDSLSLGFGPFSTNDEGWTKFKPTFSTQIAKVEAGPIFGFNVPESVMRIPVAKAYVQAVDSFNKNFATMKTIEQIQYYRGQIGAAINDTRNSPRPAESYNMPPYTWRDR
jgi:YD repeat-containing protein